MIIYQEFLALDLNEEMASFDPSERLRYAVHEIVIKMKDGGQITFAELSKKLKEFKVDISAELLKKIFEDWDSYNDPDYSIFKKEDKNWMDAWPFQGYIRRKLRDKQSFGKHRNKGTTTTYQNNRYGYWSGGKWYPNANTYPYGGEYYD
jgi:hypothetical protein